MYYLIYVSYATEPFSQTQLEELLQNCIKNNAKQQITGMLLYVNGKFIQVLEGEQEVVESVYKKIQQDKRHHKVRVIVEGKIARRNFPNWSMSFKLLGTNDLKHLTGYQDIEDYFESGEVSNSSHVALVFLKLFYQKNSPSEQI